MRPTEKVTFHFALSHLPANAVFTLNAGGGRHYTLTPYADAPGKLDEHRRRNKALALIPDERLHLVTHFAEDAELWADGLAIRTVVYPSLDDHPLPELAAVFIHIPTADRHKGYRLMRAGGCRRERHTNFDFFGVKPETLSGLSYADEVETRVAADFLVTPVKSAETVVFQHPEIGTTNGPVAQMVFTQHVRSTQAFTDLWQYISTHPAGQDTPWYDKGFVQWQDPVTGQWGNAEAASVTAADGPVQWPTDSTGQPCIPRYDLTGEAGGDSGVMQAAAPAVQEILISVKNDANLNGQLWTRQNGTIANVETNVPPEPEFAAARRRTSRTSRGGDEAGAKGFAIKNTTSSYGLDLYPSKLSYDFGSKTLSFPVKNWPNRYLGAYVQFLGSDGTPIPRSAITGWDDSLPDFLRPLFEPSDTKNFLDWISPGNQVFGIPFPTNPVTLSFRWPEQATRAEVLLGGLGCGSGFSDWDSDVDVLGVVSTGVITYGVTALSMAFTVNVINPVMSMLTRNVLLGIYAIAGAVGITGLIVGAVEHKSSAGKKILSGLATKAAGVIFGKLTGVALQQIYKQAVTEMMAKFWGFITAQEALEQIPVAGWVLKVASVAADVAALTATTVESLISPATYDLQILHTLDLTVTVTPDPRHGKPDQKPVWPLVADHWVVRVTYPAAKGESSGTTHTQAGPMPGDHTAAIVVTFPGIPAGGQCDVTASVYSSNNWLAGQWDSGWINATADEDDQLAVGGAIVENLVPLTSDTLYSQKQRVIYDADGAAHVWQVTQFSIEAALAETLDAKKPSDALRAAFAANGNDLSPDDQLSITVVASGASWTLSDTGTNTLFAVDKVKIWTGEGKEIFELRVQNTTHASPPLPEVLNDCGTGGDNHNICERVNITINNHEYQLGYSWKASGQNLPLDGHSTPSNGQMFAFQSISTLGQPQDQIIQPSHGFSLQAQLAFDQFGLTPLFYLDLATYRPQLDAGGRVPDDLAKAFANYSLPSDAAILVVTAGKEWYLTTTNEAALFVLRVTWMVLNGKYVEVINAYSYPVPEIDNYWVDPRRFEQDGIYHLRGVTFPAGVSTFDYSQTASWGGFTQGNLDTVAVHPHGYAVGVDFKNHKMFALQLPAQAVDQNAGPVPIAIPLSGFGGREGLLNQPVAMTITADGAILVLEQGNQRVQAFDVKGNPVPRFKGPLAFSLASSFVPLLDASSTDTALLQAIQQAVTPARAPLFMAEMSSVAALDQGKADKALMTAFAEAVYTLPDDPAKIQLLVTTPGSLWLLTDAVKNTTYDIRVEAGELLVYYAPSLSVAVHAAGKEWTLSDATNALTFSIAAPASGSGELSVQQLISTMTLRDQRPSTVRYLDVAVETKGYIYVLASASESGGTPVFQLDIYNPDGTALLEQPQTNVNAAKLTVDQWRTVFTLNWDRFFGPGTRTEPGVSAWIPSTPSAPSGS